MTSSNTAIRHLDKRFDTLKPCLSLLEHPPKGWIRAIRDALGMTTEQFAMRLGVSRPRITALQQDEVAGRLTLGTLEKAAQALGCRLVYALVPEEPLETSLRRQAKLKAQTIMKRTAHTMSLEDQGSSAEEMAIQLEQLVQDLLQGKRSRLWDVD